MNDVNATFESVYGKIVSSWKITDDKMVYSVEIPANTTAHVTLPNAKLGNVAMDEALKSNSKQIEKEVVLEVGSGKYEFSYPVEE